MIFRHGFGRPMFTSCPPPGRDHPRQVEPLEHPVNAIHLYSILTNGAKPRGQSTLYGLMVIQQVSSKLLAAGGEWEKEIGSRVLVGY
jgi:hypothetical protein